mmetsp:Transcript_32476/g.92039  ORF Transcript_32476/g.92039 Transcript_32476/m.92039 type:complete len:278 (-) Transcript_32476:355-1188(-)
MPAGDATWPRVMLNTEAPLASMLDSEASRPPVCASSGSSWRRKSRMVDICTSQALTVCLGSPSGVSWLRAREVGRNTSSGRPMLKPLRESSSREGSSERPRSNAFADTCRAGGASAQPERSRDCRHLKRGKPYAKVRCGESGGGQERNSDMSRPYTRGKERAGEGLGAAGKGNLQARCSPQVQRYHLLGHFPCHILQELHIPIAGRPHKATGEVQGVPCAPHASKLREGAADCGHPAQRQRASQSIQLGKQIAEQMGREVLDSGISPACPVSHVVLH